jgi:alkyl hydroperoxide reductase subunit AhpC
MPALNSDLERFAGYDAQVVGISVDSIFSHTAWQQKDIGMLKFPLLSDFYPHGEVAKKYGVLREGDPVPGISERAVFIVDKQGKIAFAKVYHLGQQPPHEDCFEVLQKLAAEAPAQAR